MKISDLLLTEIQQKTQHQVKEGGQEGDDFARVLKSQFDSHGAGSASETVRPDPMLALAAAGQTPMIHESEGLVGERVSRSIEGTADALERFQQLLGGGGSGSENVREALGDLARQVDRMRGEADTLEEGHELRRLSEELSVLAYVESYKWQRGDYA
jgi:hypothetical protein